MSSDSFSDSSWQPSADIETLRRRAALITLVRQFFNERGVLEVETPLLARHSVTDPHMPVISADNPLHEGDCYYLQTSPEYAMKRLLAAGSGPIFQLSKAFRRGEVSRRHNPEFTMLEWYRPGFSLDELMDEVEVLIRQLLPRYSTARRIAYRQLFLDVLNIDPMHAELATIESIARDQLDIQMQSDNRDDWLNLLMAEVIEPQLTDQGIVFIYNYPASQAALAKIGKDPDGTAVARRFECYVSGMELANGYDELTDARELRRRFKADNDQRLATGKTIRTMDADLLAAVEAGLPPSSGVALGLDRLIMLALNRDAISDVLSFTADRA